MCSQYGSKKHEKSVLPYLTRGNDIFGPYLRGARPTPSFVPPQFLYEFNLSLILTARAFVSVTTSTGGGG
jgi:hypothetical protein